MVTGAPLEKRHFSRRLLPLFITPIYYVYLDRLGPGLRKLQQEATGAAGGERNGGGGGALDLPRRQ